MRVVRCLVAAVVLAVVMAALSGGLHGAVLEDARNHCQELHYGGSDAVIDSCVRWFVGD